MRQRFKGKSVGVTGWLPRAGASASQTANVSKPVVRPPPGWVTVSTCLLLALAVWVVFGQTLHHEFVNYDDGRFIYENSAITQGLSLKGVVLAFTHINAAEWYPLTSLSHMLDCQLYGLKPGGHHLTNVLLHAATGILLFLVLRKLTGAFWRSAFVAAVFCIHPLRVESVAWISERKDVLSGLFFVLTLGAYARYAEVRKRRAEDGRWKMEDGRPWFPPMNRWVGRVTSWATTPRSTKPGAHGVTRPTIEIEARASCYYYWLALFFFALGLLSKTMLVTLPFVLLLLDYWPLQRIASGSRLSALDRRLIGRLFLEKIPFLLLSAAAGVATLLAQESAISSVQNLSLLPRIGNALVAYVVYLGQMLYPVGLAVFYPHPGNQLPVWTAGLAVMVLGVITVSVLRWQRQRPYLLVGWLWYLGVLVPVIGILQVGTQARADRYTYLPHIGLYVMVAWGAVDLCGGWRSRRVVLATAAALMLTGLLVLAQVQTRYWRDSVSLWTHTLACTSGNSVAHNLLGGALVKQGKWKEAIPQFERALQLDPDYAEAHINFGVALVKQGKWKEAIPQFERALQLDPDGANTYYNLGLALAKQRKWPAAIAHYERALELKPDYAEAGCNLAWLLATCSEARFRNPAEALRRAQRARELTQSRSLEVLDTLAAAQAAGGDFARAVETAKQALALATAAGNPIVAREIQRHLQLYQAGQPFYEPPPDEGRK